MGRLSVLLLANWGIGAAMLETLLALPEVRVVRVLTRHEPESADPYVNAVWNLASVRGVPATRSRDVAPEALARLIADEGIDLLLCHAYLRLLPAYVFQAPRRAAVNVHPSLLPRHRGPAPSWWVLQNREAATGLTAHCITERLDAGGIIHQVQVPVLPGDDLGALLDRLRAATPDLVRGTVARLLLKNFTAEPQQEECATYAPRPPQEG